VAIAAGLVVSPTFSRSKLKVAKTPLSEDQKQIYEFFIKSQSEGDASHMTLASTTSALFLSKSMADCLKDLQLTNLDEVQQLVHVIGPEIAAQSGIRLVDSRHYKVADPGRAIKNGKSVGRAVAEGFAAGIWFVSEIAFDSSHEHAVMKHTFYCGRLCGYGATTTYEKTADGWVEQKNVQCIEQFQF
jgi:hypothetical protein